MGEETTREAESAPAPNGEAAKETAEKTQQSAAQAPPEPRREQAADLIPQASAAPAPAPTPTPEPEPADHRADESAPAPADLESLREEIAALRAEREAMRRNAYEALLDRAGVLPEYRELVPEHDPYTEEGRSALQEWLDAHPEIVRRAESPERPRVDEFTARLESAPGRWLVSDAMLAETEGGRRR